jgi:hypothetical protein
LIREADGIGCFPAKHHIQLREAEDKRVVLINQGDIQLLAQGFGQNCAEFKPAEPGP